jgi:GTPase SAR1 family protein
VASKAFVMREPKLTDSDSIVNTTKGHKRLKSEIVTNLCKTYFVVGKKGSGKTCYLNYLINTESDNWEGNHKIVWYRVNVALLHKINLDRHIRAINTSRTFSRLTLLNFLNVCVSYITFKYKMCCEIFEDIVENKDGTFNNLLQANYDNSSNSSRSRVGAFNQLLPNFRSKARLLGDDLPATWREIFQQHKRQITELINDTNSRERCEIIRQAVFSYLRKSDYRIILFLDGVDNIDYHQQPDMYKAMLVELGEVINHCEILLDTDKVVVALRSDTVHHLRDLSINVYLKEYAHFSVDNNDIVKCVQTKSDLAGKIESDYYSKRLRQSHDAIIDNFENQETKIDDQITPKEHLERCIVTLSNEIPITLDNLLKAFNNTGLVYRPDMSIDEFFEIIYNGNLRDVMFSCLNTQRYLALLREKDNIAEIRDHHMLEGFFLAGYLYMDSAIEEKPKGNPGRTLLNLFYYDYSDAVDKKKWHGLCLLRILQLVESSIMREDEICDIITSLLGTIQKW